MYSKEATIYNAILISCAVLGIIITYFIISIIRHQRKNLELHRQNILAEITTLEQERSRMSSDLHDELGPLLSVIKFEIDSIETAAAEDSRLLNKVSRQIDEVIGRLRNIAKNLMPAALARKGLVVAINEFIDAINETSSINIHFSSDIKMQPDQGKSINIFRIIQEIIHNAIRHANAHKLTIQIRQQGKELIVLCHDDGRGFNYNKILEGSSGLGLRNIKSRVEIMKGVLQIESQPEKGTHYLITIPT